MTIKHKRIREEIKQAKPFRTVSDEAFVTLQRTSDVVLREFTRFLKTWAVSPTQYNVLRILRGAGADGLRCGEIAERMITHDPDITRLLDRMERAGWIERARDSKDRRVVVARVSKSGLDLLKQIDRPIEDHIQRTSGHMTDKRMRLLVDLLDELRAGFNQQL